LSEQDRSVPTGGAPRGREGPTDLVLVAGIAWIALAMIGVIPSAVLVARGPAAPVGMMVAIALVVLPFVNVFQLWHAPTALNAVRAASYSFVLAGLAVTLWIAGREFEPLVAVVAAGLALPGVLSLLAAWQLHDREPARAGPAAPSGNRFGLSTSVVVVLVAVALVAAYLLLTPTFSERFTP
jgi:hypothetical protein